VSDVFLDTSAWLPALDPRDSNHTAAQSRYMEAARSRAVLVTTPFVVAETHAMVLRRRGPSAGQEFLRAALAGSHVRVVHATPELIASAVTDWIMHFADQRFSLCDAVSFEVMRHERIRRVLTRDRHFATAGFEILS